MCVIFQQECHKYTCCPVDIVTCIISFLTYTAGFAQIIVSFMILHNVISQKTIIWVFHFLTS